MIINYISLYNYAISLLRPMIGKDIPIPYMNIAMSLVSFTVPLLLGVAFKRKWPKKALVLSKKVERSIYHHITISLSLLQHMNWPKKVLFFGKKVRFSRNQILSTFGPYTNCSTPTK